MSNDLGIGKLIKKPVKRDCIHFALLPCIAGEELGRGDEVGFIYGSTEIVKRKSKDYGCEPIGIVDPFLEYDHGQYNIKVGQRFWVIMKPGTVTGMRHEWDHPCLKPEVPKNDAEKWLREFADIWNFDYDEMISNASEDEGYVTARGRDLHGAGELEAGHEEEFWKNMEILTGKTFNSAHRSKLGWSCTC